MDNELAITPENMPSLIPTDEETAGGGDSTRFIPAIKLLQGLSKEVGKDGNEQGQFYVSSDELNLGKEVEIVVVHRRSHALLLEGNKKTLETFNIKSPIWYQIKRTKDDRDREIVKFIGEGDWLWYLPAHNKFFTYFCGKAATYPLTVELKIYMTPPDKRKLEVDRDREWTNHFTLYSEVKTWGDKFRAMSPKVRPLETFDVNEIDMALATEATNMFFAPVQAEPDVEETSDVER